MENPNPQTFNVAEMFAGISFPETVVDVYTNPGVAYAYTQLSADAVAAAVSGDPEAVKDVETRQAELVATAEKFRYQFHLQGVMQDIIDALHAKALEEHPPVKSAPQIPGFPAQQELTDEFYEYLNLLTWQTFITKIVAPDGREVVSPDSEFVALLKSKLPLSEKKRLEAAIRKFADDTKAGFESIVQERDFLSKASSEA